MEVRRALGAAHRLKRDVVIPTGGLLHPAGMGSEHLADARAAAVAVEEGGVIVTGDPSDLERLTLAMPHVTVAALEPP